MTRQAPPDEPDRQKITAELVKRTWLDMSTGLRVMTQHAKILGYDGIVLERRVLAAERYRLGLDGTSRQ